MAEITFPYVSDRAPRSPEDPPKRMTTLRTTWQAKTPAYAARTVCCVLQMRAVQILHLRDRGRRQT